MKYKAYQQPTEFRLEFWTDVSGAPRKHRSRYYPSVENMLRAGARWESKGLEYYCRYWNGLSTWVSTRRSKQVSDPTPMTAPLGRARVSSGPRPRVGARPHSQIFSIFGLCEATAAEIMLKDGRAWRKIPVNEIPDSALFNTEGRKALFAVVLPRENIEAFEELCKDIRA